jgi:hypothetical protein
MKVVLYARLATTMFMILMLGGISRDGRFLYVIASFIRALKSYRIQGDGSLTPLQTINDLP